MFPPFSRRPNDFGKHVDGLLLSNAEQKHGIIDLDCKRHSEHTKGKLSQRKVEEEGDEKLHWRIATPEQCSEKHVKRFILCKFYVFVAFVKEGRIC